MKAQRREPEGPEGPALTGLGVVSGERERKEGGKFFKKKAYVRQGRRLKEMRTGRPRTRLRGKGWD